MKGISLVAAVAVALAGCGTPTKTEITNPKTLAHEQWESCSDFPSVELVEISDDGNILVRDKQYSAPPFAFRRCLMSKAYDQVFEGRRHARDMIVTAHFTDEVPEGFTSEMIGPFPSKKDSFRSDEDVRFYLVMKGSDRPLNFTFEWTGPGGVMTVYSEKRPSLKRRYINFSINEAYSPERQGGSGPVRLDISMNGYPLGTFHTRIE